MKQVTYGVRDLQARIGEVLKAAERGDRVIITRQGRPVAVLAGTDAPIPGETRVERKLRRLAARGKIRVGRFGLIPPYRVPAVEGLARQLEADRR